MFQNNFIDCERFNSSININDTNFPKLLEIWTFILNQNTEQKLPEVYKEKVKNYALTISQKAVE